eukprot:FR736406.1.p1 GENE.FR736406.1~~FR736406.1.p1  ORF type:complete len:115 (+),score=1.05 FR736406.1:266-610(+)
MLDNAREHISRTNRKMELVECHAERLPFQDATFDVVVMTNVLCSVESPSQCVAEVARVLKPGCRYLFMEHVMSEDNIMLAASQSMFNPLQQQYAQHASRCLYSCPPCVLHNHPL